MSRRHRTPKEALVYFDFEESIAVVKSKKLHGDVVIDNIVDIVCDGKKLECRILGLSDDPAELIALDEQFWKNGGLDSKLDTSELQSAEKLVDQTGDMEDDGDEPPQPPPKKPRKGAKNNQTSNPDDSIQEFVDRTIGTLLDNTAVYHPDRIEIRKRNRIKRIMYQNPEPDFIWHVDSYDKLKPFGICINGAIDGYSRHNVWLEAHSTNSDPAVISSYYVNAVKENEKAVQSEFRADRGTENGHIEHMQLEVLYMGLATTINELNLGGHFCENIFRNFG
ncbi:uncharacterized protein LOC117125140 [Anneissia japonica]|uniref:uncharacterized protein LOC117125140 n=1 Tax=Anneissia japonica TaxID=1529436 RepID=UPI0014259C65|nr:uncharacterized protein LOC117125140 [Anneissia japonica]